MAGSTRLHCNLVKMAEISDHKTTEVGQVPIGAGPTDPEQQDSLVHAEEDIARIEKVYR